MAEEPEAGQTTPEQTISDDIKLSALFTPGSDSSSRKKGKRVVSKKRREASAGEEKTEESPIAPLPLSSPTPTSRPKKLIIRPGEGSNGGRKKK